MAAIDGPNQYSFGAQGVWGSVEKRMLDAMGALGSVHSHDPAFRTAANVTKQSDRLRRQLLPFAKQNGITSPVPYPTGNDGFTTGLQGVAAMIAAGLPLRCVALEASGSYDTHAGQAAALTPALTTTAASLFSFQRDLEARGIADRVLTLVWSEFGRRAQENGSGGTDHGAAGTAFLIGSRAIGTAVGEFPGLSSLDPDGNLKADLGLPLRLQLAARAVARLRRRPGDPGRREVQALQARQVKTLAALALSAFALTGSSPAPARVQIVAREYSYTLSRLHVKAGEAILELDNFGQDPHDLRVQRDRVEARREARQGRAREVRRFDAAPASGAILALVLDRRSSPEGNARDPDRHALTFDDVGDPAGWPVLYFHGGGDSRLTRHPDDGIAASLGIRLIAVERSGPAVPGRTLVTWARDVEALADGLGLDRFSVVGWSAGGPHALAVAAVLARAGRARRARRVDASARPHRGARARRAAVAARGDAGAALPRAPARSLGAEADAADRPSRHRRGLPARARRVVPGGRDVARPGAGRRSAGRGASTSATISAPVVLWWGESDVVCPPSIGRDYEARLPDGDAEAGGGHPSGAVPALAGHPRATLSPAERHPERSGTTWRRSPTPSRRF